MTDDGRNGTFTGEDTERELGFFENGYADSPDSKDGTFGRALLPNERIIYSAQGRSAKGSIFYKLFAVAWVSFLAVWLSAALFTLDIFAAVFGLPHILVGVILLFKAVFIRTGVRIAVTDKRLLIKYLGKIQAVYLNKGEKQGRAMTLPTDNDSYWNVSFEGIRCLFSQRGAESGNHPFDTFEFPREDAVKIADTIDRIIKGEYI